MVRLILYNLRLKEQKYSEPALWKCMDRLSRVKDFYHGKSLSIIIFSFKF